MNLAVVDLDDLRTMIDDATRRAADQAVRRVLEDLAERLPVTPDEILDINGAAEMLGITTRNVRDAVRDGECPQPIYHRGWPSSWRWSSRQFLAPQSPPAIGASGGGRITTMAAAPAIQKEAA